MKYLTIEEGTVYGYNSSIVNGNVIEYRDVVKDMRITIVDQDTIVVHCYKDAKDYTLHRVTE